MKNSLFYYLAEKLLNADYQFAKTMPDQPHYYTLRKNWDSSEFTKVVQLIRDYGYGEYYGGRKYTYFNLNGYKYWTMGYPANQTTVLNRAKIAYQTDYDEIAEDYDSYFSDEESLKENEDVFSMFTPHGKILDIGCGTGLLLDYQDIEPQNYIGIDPSKKMLSIFKQKHPAHEVIQTKFEDFYYGKFDFVVSTFGSLNYVEPKYMTRIKEMCDEAFVMTWQEDYSPVVEKKADFVISDNHFYHNLRGKTFNNYIISTYEDLP